jgi:lysylphosphatidylglycerol synthetase-like protein (DUF2156 family)/UDP-2,3-diacylglucosamine pyrophosphatase LpxH
MSGRPNDQRPTVVEVEERPPLIVPVVIGSHVLVIGDLHLGAVPSEAWDDASAELVRRLEGVTGPAVLVLAGDIFELWTEPNNSPAKALRAHPRFTEAIQRFGAGDGRRVVLVAGNHDGALAWDDGFRDEVGKLLQAEVASAVDLEITTGRSTERVRVEHGHQLDAYNAFTDPAVAGDRPLGFHVARMLVPALSREPGREAWMSDLAALNQPSQFANYVASRLFYRRLARHSWWLVAPAAVVAALVWLLPLVLAPFGPRSARVLADAAGMRLPLGLAGVALVLNVGLVLLGLLGAARRSVAAIESLGLDGDASGGGDANASARRRAVDLAERGYRGYITGHTHQPEMSDLGEVFYANCGCNALVVQSVPTWAGLPPVFEAVQQSSWLDLTAGPDLGAELWSGQLSGRGLTGRGPTGLGLTGLERLAVRRTERHSPRPVKVATLAPQTRWPSLPVRDHHRRDRRAAAAAVALVGVVNIVSSLTPPIRDRAAGLRELLPPTVPATASLATAASGVGLLVLAAGLRRGQRRAWLVALSLLTLSGLANLGKGLDIEEAIIAFVVAVVVAARHASFRAVSDPRASRRAVGLLAFLAAATAGAALLVAAVGHLPVQALVTDFTQRLLGLSPPPLARRWRTVSAALSGMGLATVAYAAWLALRPLRVPAPAAEDEARAWQLVRRHGQGSLDYFALRDDKLRVTFGDTLVAFSVHRGVALVSPDPIGPNDEQGRAWAAFQDYAANHGWSVAVLGASEEWLPIYHRSGMRSIYVGDEAVVDVQRFTLDGSRNKHLRQAVNRVERAGYQVSLMRSADVDPATAVQLRAMLGQSRKGEVERGYSMTLSRLLDPRDPDLLLAIARDGDGSVAAFCQFVPAPGIGGYSLDLMRRADGALPNGLTDYVIVRTIEHLRQRGETGLCLNFATMRAVLAGEMVDSWLNRRQRWLLMRLGDSMQIESLWRFNAKYDPQWTPRYLVIEGTERLLPAALAVASAESLWELPVLGRFLRPFRPSAGVGPCADEGEGIGVSGNELGRAPGERRPAPVAAPVTPAAFTPVAGGTAGRPDAGEPVASVVP